MREGYLNVDFAPHHSPDLVADVTHLPMLPADYFEEIVAQDVLEHFERGKTQAALQEWARLLSPTGILFIRVPSLLHMADLLVKAEGAGAEEAEKIIHLFYGTQAYTGDYHLAGFTASSLARHLSSSGLHVDSVGLRDGWLFEVFATKQARRPAKWPVSETERPNRVLDEVYHSTSWRITAPLRKLRQLTRFR
ncbi:class I SAM-dependent methyltransferase [Chelatococcus sp. GCM10030263]|uniref:class I SAM-dependent methyltransferase n=1 Tax=Chelatococcus sp. GCM10030263 TaxID=3273387 RepID=UPI003614017F